MNDFTKEELEFFFKYMIQCGSRGNLSKYNEILLKVKSMIDNYCDHEERITTSDENGHMLVMCGRCDLVLWHEKN